MKRTGSIGLMLAALTAAACQGGVDLQAAAGVTSSSSTTSGSGGSGGGCSVSLPAGCSCPDNAGEWGYAFSALGSSDEMYMETMGALPVAPDGSAALHLTVMTDTGNGIKNTASRIVKLDATGQILWDRQEDPAADFFSLAPDPRDCSTVVTGTIPTGTTSLLDKTLSCSTAACPFVARLDAGGSALWVQVYDSGSDGFATPWIAGILADGRIALAGPFQGTIDLGNGPLVAPDVPGSGVFVALLSPEGDALWSRHFTKVTPPMYPNTIWLLASAVVSPEGDITVAATPNGPTDFGDGPLPAPGASVLGGLVLASYDVTGALRFGKVITTGSGTTSPSLARDSAGHLIVAETVQGAVDFGGGPIVPDPGASLTVVAAFDGDGQYLWSKGIDTGTGLAVGADDHIWVGSGAGNVAELDPGGTTLAMHPIGSGAGSRFSWSIGIAPGGAPVVAGVFDGTFTLGGATITAESKRDVFVAALAQ